jgi:hypothetical protein
VTAIDHPLVCSCGVASPVDQERCPECGQFLHEPDPLEYLELRAADDHEAPPAEEPANLRRHLVDGGTFVLDAPDTVPAIWGHDGQVAWANGESLLIVGPAGVGKSTVAAQLVRARLGLQPEVLGLPVTPTGSKVLYLASDRSPQIARAFRRIFTPDDRQVLDDRLVVWKGPPPSDLAKRPEMLGYLANLAGADTVFLDSLKDMAVGLSDDEVGAGLNRAIQLALANGIDVAGLHHQRKAQNGTKPKTLEDVYGSTWITAGAGSVLLLWGAAGDPLVELLHLKQPAEALGPWKVEHDHHAGTSTVVRGFDPLAWLRHLPAGGTAPDAARVMTEKSSPSDNDRKKAQRLLDGLVRKGLATKSDAQRAGDGGAVAARYFAVDNHHEETP